MHLQKSSFTKIRITASVLVAVFLLGIGYAIVHAFMPQAPDDIAENLGTGGPAKAVAVKVVSPRTGGMDRTTTQPGSILAFESVELHAAVSGYLKTLNVDIGSNVKKGDLLAVIEVPELDKQLLHHKAVVEQAMAKVAQMRARKTAAEADLDAAKATVKRSVAAADSAKAWVRFRDRQLHRMEDLSKSKSIDERLLDESKEQYEAAVESSRAADETIVSSQAREVAAGAKIIQSAADIDEALANVKVAQAEVDKTQELLNYANIKAPFDGMISKRTVFPGDFIRAASGGTLPVPMLTIDCTDKMRVVVQLPDRDVPYADIGDEAIVEVDALPGQPIKAAISRIAGAENDQTRMMRIEIDLPNPTGKLRKGMYGYVTITLEKSANVLALPSSCLVGKENNKAQVFVVRNGRAVQAPVTLVGTNGSDVGVIGLKAEDQVIANPGIVTNGTAVTISAKKKR